MNTYIIVLVIGLFSISDFIFPNQKKQYHDLTFKMAFLFFCIAVSIKYYVVPDISIYVPLYESLTDFSAVWKKLTAQSYVESGFVIYCAILNFFGCGYWAMTFIVSLFYFYTIYKVLTKISTCKTFALLVIAYSEQFLYLTEYRQSIAVCFFILGFLYYLDKKKLKFYLFWALALFFHKSAWIVIPLQLVVMMMFEKKTYSRKWFLSLLIVFVLCLVIPLKSILIGLANFLPVNEISKSIIHHLTLFKPVQLIGLVYISFLCFVYAYSSEKLKGPWSALILLFAILVTVLYQNFFLLQRVRSYFIPLVVVYCIQLYISEPRNNRLWKQLTICSCYAVCVYMLTIGYITTKRKFEHRNMDMNYTTVFSLIKKTPSEIKKEKMREASYFWKNVYLKE